MDLAVVGFSAQLQHYVSDRHQYKAMCTVVWQLQVLFAGLMSGLTLGLMSMDVVELEVLR
jgi:hypothetical protein